MGGLAGFGWFFGGRHDLAPHFRRDTQDAADVVDRPSQAAVYPDRAERAVLIASPTSGSLLLTIKVEAHHLGGYVCADFLIEWDEATQIAQSLA